MQRDRYILWESDYEMGNLSPKPLRDLFMQVRVGRNQDIVLLLILSWVDWVGLGWM